MEDYDPLDLTEKETTRELWTIRFLLVSACSIVLLFGISGSSSIIHISHRIEGNLLILLNLIAGVSAISGLVMGFTEWKLNRKRALIGIIGNGLIICGYLFLLVVVFIVITNLNPH